MTNVKIMGLERNLLRSKKKGTVHIEKVRTHFYGLPL